MGRTTTIPVDEETKERLEALGTKGETWDELLSRLADELVGRP